MSGSSTPVYDLIVVGAGPVGMAGAFEGAALGKQVVVVDAGPSWRFGTPSGLPSKALRSASNRYDVPRLCQRGMSEDLIWAEIMGDCDKVMRMSSSTAMRRAKEAGIEVVRGSASFKQTLPFIYLVVGGGAERIIRGEHILLATGSSPAKLKGLPSSKQRIFDSFSIGELSYLPSSIAISGCGVVAIEYAQIFKKLGLAVVLILRNPCPIGALSKLGLDPSVAVALLADMTQSGIQIESGFQVGEFDVPFDARDPIRITLEKTKSPTELARKKICCRKLVFCDVHLTAVGSKPNTASLNLSAANIEVTEGGAILVDNQQRTTASFVYAAGDVCGAPFLVSRGIAQAELAVQTMFSKASTQVQKPPRDPPGPICMWTSPEVAWFGLTDQKPHGPSIGVGLACYSDSLRGCCMETSPSKGFLKLVFSTGSCEILGVHIFGSNACELIHYGAELVKGRRTLEEVSHQAMFCAVTFHELYKIAAKDGLRSMLQTGSI